MQRRILSVIVLAGLSAIVAGSAAGANPSDQDVHAYLEPHDLTKSRQELERTHKLIQDVSTAVQAAIQKNGIILAKDLSLNHVRLRQARRGAYDLEIHGETAGVDFSIRVMLLDRGLKQLLEQFKTTKAGVAQADKIRAFLMSPKNIQIRTNKLQQLQQAARQQQWLPAYAALVEAMDELTSYTMFLSTTEEAEFVKPFAGVQDEIIMGRNRAVAQQVRQALFEAGTAQLPDLAAVVTELTAAATALRTQPTAGVGGNALPGPQCVEHFGNAWKKAHLAAYRSRAIEWARVCAAPGVIGMYTPPEPRRMKEEAYARFGDEMVKGLAALIDADATRATVEEVPSLYLAHLRALASLVVRSADEKVELATGPALEKLALKSPAFAKEQLGYREATDEALRWRERTATALATAKSAGVAASADLLVQAFASRADYRGLMTENAPKLKDASLLGCCPEVLMGGSAKLVNQKLVVRQGRGMSGGKLGVARYADRHYAMLSLPSLDEQVALLKQDLLVTEQLPALSLRAATAIEAASSGDFAAAGGAVKTVYLEGLIPRFATIRDSALPLLPLGPFPAEGVDTDILGHVLVRLDVTPQWLQNRYFFVALGAATPAATAPQ